MPSRYNSAMSYEQFTLEMLENQFGLTLAQAGNLFGEVPPCAPSELLTAVLKRHLPLVVGKGTEKVRSELLIAPILVEARELLHGQISLFSGVAFNVDRKSGLHGFCDFLISRDPLLIEIKAPVIAVAEAKREDLSSGIAQCLAELVAAQRFNEKRGTQATLDLREYPITELENILGILVYMASA